MSQTISVWALDAADYSLLQEWECENILVDNHSSIETFSHTYDRPYTPEVWATVATGKSPDEHGISGEKANWNNPILNFGSEIFSTLPDNPRSHLGKLLEEIGFSPNNQAQGFETVFDGGEVTQWPGITDATHFSTAQKWLSQINDGNMSEAELWNRLLANTGMEMGWLIALANSNLPIVGIHSHILDVSGHVYASRPEKLKEYYKFVDAMVSIVADNCDELVILSDHGMEVELLKDPDPGKHSWRSFISTTFEGEVPSDMEDVRPWLEKLKDNSRIQDSPERIDAPEEHLRDLGYF